MALTLRIEIGDPVGALVSGLLGVHEHRVFAHHREPVLACKFGSKYAGWIPDMNRRAFVRIHLAVGSEIRGDQFTQISAEVLAEALEAGGLIQLLEKLQDGPKVALC